MANKPQPGALSLSSLPPKIAAVALVAFGLFFPLIGLKTEQNMANEVVLRVRPWAALGAVLAAVAAFVIVTLVKAAKASRSAAAPPAAAGR